MTKDPKTNKPILFMVYGGSSVTPLFSSTDLSKCVDFMNRGGLSSLACYTLKLMVLD